MFRSLGDKVQRESMKTIVSQRRDNKTPPKILEYCPRWYILTEEQETVRSTLATTIKRSCKVSTFGHSTVLPSCKSKVRRSWCNGVPH